jgi:hypothetical protein
MGFVGVPGQVRRYMSGLCAATLGLCAAGWLALAPVAFGYRSAGRAGTPLPSAGLQRAAWADWATAAGLAAVSLVTLACWIVAWRRRLRADGILARASRRQARRQTRQEARAQRRERGSQAAASTPDPAQVLSELRTLLTPLLAGEPAHHEPGAPAIPHPRPGGLAAMESMLAGTELLMVGCGEEEAW